MEYRNDNLDELLDYIDPAAQDYQTWLGIGMALKDAGFDVSVWDSWSARDGARYHDGECEKKWRSFTGSEHPVTAGTIVHLALENGYQPKNSSAAYDAALDWDSYIGEEYVVTSSETTQDMPIQEPANWNPASEIRRYLEALFELTDYVGYVTEVYENENGDLKPGRGSYSRTVEELLKELMQYDGDVENVFGTINPTCGAWIRFNPLDGQGVRDNNVAKFRYALVESDKIPLAQQNGIIHDLKLPVAALVFTGNKSLHAIVKVDAVDFKEYRERVDFLYKICDKNGLVVDRNCRNPSRLSRMPGVMRNGRKQFLVETNTGFPSWDAWKDWIESVNDSFVVGIKSLFEIQSPSKLMKRVIGKNLALGIGEGFTEEIPDVGKDAVRAFKKWEFPDFPDFPDAPDGKMPTFSPDAVQTLRVQNTAPVVVPSATSEIVNNYYNSQTTNAVQAETPQASGDIIIPVSIGGQHIETVVVKALQIANAQSGGVTI